MIVLRTLLVGVIQGYQYLVSPFLGTRCRFYPSCSSYAVYCYKQYSVTFASWRVINRLCKCHPFHPGGVDLP